VPNCQDEAPWLETDTPAGHCYHCKEPFSDQNVHSAAGWAETRISGMCENCWDELFADEDEDEDDL
jgi:hypothetical protein